MTNAGFLGYPSGPVVTQAAAGTLASGNYYYTSGWRAAGAFLTTGNMLCLYPWVVPHAVTLAKIGAEVTSGGNSGSTVRLGIYADSGSLPGALILDAGTINGASGTVQQVTVNQVIPAGVVWIGGAAQGVTSPAPTVRSAQDAPAVAVPLIGGLPTANGTAIGVYVTGVSGALPASFGTPTGNLASAAGMRVIVKIT